MFKKINIFLYDDFQFGKPMKRELIFIYIHDTRTLLKNKYRKMNPPQLYTRMNKVKPPIKEKKKIIFFSSCK